MMKNDVYKEVVHREDGIEMVEQVLNEIVQKAGDIVYKHHMQRRVVPYAVQRMKSDIITIIDWMFITHDVGENVVQSGESISDHGDLSWVEDLEPLSCPIDTWAKSALTIIPVSTNILPPDPSLDNSTEVLSIAPSNANKRKLKAKTKSLEENASLNNSESPSLLTTSPSAMSLQRQKNPTQKSNTTYPQNTNTQKEDTQKSKISHVFASTQIKRQPTKNEIEQEQAEKFEKLRRELKGKEYSYDHNGNMVLLNNVDADKPNKEKVVPVKISIADDESSTQQEENENTKPTTKSRSTSANKNGKPKKSDFVKETRPPQPSAFENIKLAPGVTLRDGNKIKEGAPISTLLQQQNTPTPTFSSFGKNPPKMPPILPSLTLTPQQTQSPSPPILAWVDDSEKISLPNIKLNSNNSNNKIEPRSSTASSRG